MKSPICDMLGIEFPLLAFSHCRDVVAAVSRAGGFGVFGATAHSPESVEAELKWIDEHVGGKPYGIPADNPFVGREGVAPEIWAYGLRNVWRMAFDKKTGKLWAGEVGQNLFEEINIIRSGGNYGWSVRESLHPFGAKGTGVREDLIDPIWEYHHDIGKSITGGFVYRGSKLPELAGAYLYADYVSARVWALWYDEAKGRVIANREIKGPTLPIVSFGEDADGEPYLLTVTESGKGIHRLVRDTK